MPDRNPSAFQEINRRFFADIEKDADWITGPVQPIKPDAYPKLYAFVKNAALKLDIETPIELFHAPMRIPHAMSLEPNKIVISDSALEILNEQEVALYVGHKLGHQIHGIKHLISKGSFYGITGAFTAIGALIGLSGKNAEINALFDEEEPSRRKILSSAAGAIAGSMIGTLVGLPINETANYFREREADKVAVDLAGSPEILLSMLTKLKHWCDINKLDADMVYPGIGYRLNQAKEMMKKKPSPTHSPHA